MAVKGALDRSAMDANLSTMSEKFGRMEASAARGVVTEALAAWYDTTEDDMYAFTRRWVQAYRKDLLPLRK